MDGCKPYKISNDVSRKKVDTDFYLDAIERIIPENQQVKLLGVTTDSNLKSDSHIQICGKVYQKTCALIVRFYQ